MTLSANTAPVVLADPGDWGGHMDGWGWGSAWFMGLVMVLIVILVAWLIWSTTRGWDRRTPQGSTALDVLDERYARGEIEREEYLRRRDDLKG